MWPAGPLIAWPTFFSSLIMCVCARVHQCIYILAISLTGFLTLDELLKVCVLELSHYTMGVMIESACCED